MLLYESLELRERPSIRRGFLLKKTILHQLAGGFGRSEALLLQQVHYLTINGGIEREGRKWLSCSVADWHSKHYPFMSESAIKNALRNLEQMGLLESRKFTAWESKHTKSYAVNYDQIKQYERSGYKLLLPGDSTSFSAALAAEIGINGAIFVSQLHYWLAVEAKHTTRSKRANIYDGKYWQFSTIAKWRQQMPWIKSERTVQRLIRRLETNGLVETVKCRNNSLRYSLNYEALTGYGFEAPTTPERREFTRFFDPQYEYTLQDNDIGWLHSFASRLFDHELDGDDLKGLQLAIEQHGKQHVTKWLREYRDENGIEYVRHEGFANLIDPYDGDLEAWGDDGAREYQEWLELPSKQTSSVEAFSPEWVRLFAPDVTQGATR
jgi:predicted transcriptional regulator